MTRGSDNGCSSFNHAGEKAIGVNGCLGGMLGIIGDNVCSSLTRERNCYHSHYRSAKIVMRVLSFAHNVKLKSRSWRWGRNGRE